METLKHNGYEIRWNPLYKTWQISHKDIGTCIAEFNVLTDAIRYCENG